MAEGDQAGNGQEDDYKGSLKSDAETQSKVKNHGDIMSPGEHRGSHALAKPDQESESQGQDCEIEASQAGDEQDYGDRGKHHDPFFFAFVEAGPYKGP